MEGAGHLVADFLKPVKALIYLTISVFTVWILGGVVPKILNMLDSSEEKFFLYAVYYIGIFCIFSIPQYIVWMRADHEIPFWTPITSIAVLTSTMAFCAILTMVKARLMSAFDFSDFSETFFTIVFWIVMILMLSVPQIFVYDPEYGRELKEQVAG